MYKTYQSYFIYQIKLFQVYIVSKTCSRAACSNRWSAGLVTGRSQVRAPSGSYSIYQGFLEQGA